jgi:hypothetical protein
LRCLFCKADSTASRSVEHIIPESLGNTTQTLPPGVVCDACNNYFAREVEKPFMDSPSVVLLRFHQEVISKRGRVPPIAGVMSPGVPVTLRRHPKSEIGMSADVPTESFDLIARAGKGELILPMEAPPPEARVVSRFLAKVALEALAQRLVGKSGGLEFLVDDAQFDPIRHHARRGTTPMWATHSRRIYDAHARWAGEDGQSFQVVHECDFLVTDSSEWHFVLALFGQEYVINMGGPDIDGYLRWLQEHDNASPLYYGKNAPGDGTPYRPAE